jgi:dsDNA-specific endonuclease/ATPase MutS2
VVREPLRDLHAFVTESKHRSLSISQSNSHQYSRLSSEERGCTEDEHRGGPTAGAEAVRRAAAEVHRASDRAVEAGQEEDVGDGVGVHCRGSGSLRVG